jgi:ribosomal protein S12 methylthiotransferase accessory factor
MIDLAASRAKAAGSFDRCVLLEATLELVPRLREAYAITRVGNITRLDRIGIPTFCAIVPTSTRLCVHNGKGVTNEAALASAVFEAVERQIAASPRMPIKKQRVEQICEMVDLHRLGLKAGAQDVELDCVEGRDILNDRSVLVPLAIVHLRHSDAPIFPAVTSNGLASGNTILEATYHALCELIERHAWSLYRMRCELLPRVLWGPQSGDLPLAEQVRMPTGDPTLDKLIERVQAQGLHLRISYLRERHLPPVMFASIVEDGSDPPMSHAGLGCSLSPVHAAVRAVTEAAQSRLTDIQGAREDAMRVNDARGDLPEHTRRLSKGPKNVWFFDLPARVVELSAIADESTDDLAEDARRIVSALARFGASSATIVDMSPADMPVNVVRAIVPELETTCLDGRIGPKARETLNPFSTL